MEILHMILGIWRMELENTSTALFDKGMAYTNPPPPPILNISQQNTPCVIIGGGQTDNFWLKNKVNH